MSEDRRPHSRACGITPHEHGTACHPNCPTCGSVFAPAAAVPEAQDGRDREDRWNDALNEANRRYGGHRRVVAPLLALADAEIAASAAVREGERERLAAVERLCVELSLRRDAARRGSESDDSWLSGKSAGLDQAIKRLRAVLAAPSLAAPEGTEQ